MKNDKDLITQIVSEVIDTPFIKEIVRVLIDGVKDSTPDELVKTLIWRDIEFSINMLELIVTSIWIQKMIFIEIRAEIESFPDKLKNELIKKLLDNSQLQPVIDLINDKEKLGELVFGITDTLFDRVPVANIAWKLLKKQTFGKMTRKKKGKNEND